MSPLVESDKEKFNKLYLSLNQIKIPDFTDPEAVHMGEKVNEGLSIIKKAIKEISVIINK